MKKNFKIEELDKQNIFKVPDKYFDDLPMRIQSRVEHPVSGWVPVWGTLKYAIPSMLIIAIAYFTFIKSPNLPEYDVLLNEASTEELLSYLNYTNVSTDEIIESIDIETLTLESMENDESLFEDLDNQDLIEIYQDLNNYNIEQNI